MSSTGSDTRTRILAAAWKLLEENRGKNVRMSDIATAAALSRQAVYLHFGTRNDLMVATVKYGDELHGAQAQVQPWRDANEGAAKLDAWIAFWGNYLPQIFGVAKALMVARENDEAAAAAWKDRMADIRNSCRTTIESVEATEALAPCWTVETAADLLWTMLSVPSWDQLTTDCGWSTTDYVQRMQRMAARTFLATATE